MRYEIGDALAVAGHNEPADVDEFLAAYGVAGEQLIALPPAHDANGGVSETRIELRTAAQAFEQTLDVFGKPTARFFAALAEYATDADERAALELLGASGVEGGAARKACAARSERIADVLRAHPSARPPIEQLAAMVPRIEPRHYSIASSSKAHPDHVHLLVVTHSWSGDNADAPERAGLCSHYLARVRRGAKVVCSLVPSVMHMPADMRRPIVLTGLGTGMAPFRAFWQERQWQREQYGADAVGPIMLYFGARSRGAEYLYAEDIEALAFGEQPLLEAVRLAFSRDQAEKVYVQHLLRKDAGMLKRALLEEQGSFYLCGPTWPVKDVREALIAAFDGDASKFDDLKEDGRLIQEVY